MHVSWQLKERMRKAGLRVQCGTLFPIEKADVVLLSCQANLLGQWFEVRIAPGSCQLSGDPPVSRLAHEQQAFIILSVQHGDKGKPKRVSGNTEPPS